MQTDSIEFVCERCGNCCQWPGEVVLSESEITKMAKDLSCNEKEFIQKYTTLRQSRAGLTLSEKSDGSCIFLEGNSCKVHHSKPNQCRNFPNKWRFPGWRQICEATPQMANNSSPQWVKKIYLIDGPARCRFSALNFRSINNARVAELVDALD